MNIEIIKSLKERAKEMLKDNYDRKIGDEEIYTIICELENFYTAYEKEKEKNSKAIGHIEACKTSLGNYILSPNETEYLLSILKEE